MRNGRFLALLAGLGLIILFAVSTWEVLNLQGGAQIMLASIALLSLVAATALALEVAASERLAQNDSDSSGERK